ncbi:MAG: hypothetical protein RSE56_01580 [Bacilli bacterium]
MNKLKKYKYIYFGLLLFFFCVILTGLALSIYSTTLYERVIGTFTIDFDNPLGHPIDKELFKIMCRYADFGIAVITIGILGCYSSRFLMFKKYHKELANSQFKPYIDDLFGNGAFIDKKEAEQKTFSMHPLFVYKNTGKISLYYCGISERYSYEIIDFVENKVTELHECGRFLKFKFSKNFTSGFYITSSHDFASRANEIKFHEYNVKFENVSVYAEDSNFKFNNEFLEEISNFEKTYLSLCYPNELREQFSFHIYGVNDTLYIYLKCYKTISETKIFANDYGKFPDQKKKLFNLIYKMANTGFEEEPQNE